MPVDFKNEMRRCWIFSWVCLRIASDSDSFGIGSVIEEIGMVPLAFRAVENNNAENTRLAARLNVIFPESLGKNEIKISFFLSSQFLGAITTKIKLTNI